ncbi:hypothetical protein E6C27_scaffold853G001000 [Cucumis melo var. makuwa]|uniref:Uncharacterized protein n=1 Tax=Cucumis melo var. makuwa TaxID=1194695 RepID=A0A5A7STX5_CUCMM|nr:hypothetical protein E6C27_scaffold853G001000 [Cucumis melo var. makuwa]
MMFLKLLSWKKACIFEEASIFEGILEVEDLDESLDLQSSKMFLKLESWKKVCIFKGALIFEGGRLQELRRFLSLGRILSRPSRAKNFQLFQLKRTPLFIEFLSGTAVSDPTSIGGQSGFCRQIHRPSRSDQAPSSFREVVLPSAIQLLSGDDRAFAVRSTVLGTIGFLPSDPPPCRSDRAPSSFGEVVLPSAIRLLSGDDRAFAIRSTALVKAIKYVHRLERWGQNCTIDVFLEKQRWSYTVVVLLMLQHIRNEVELFIYLFYFFCADISFRGGRAASTSMKPKCTLRKCASFGSTRLICASFGSTRLICLSFGSTRLICASFESTRLICASLGITRLIGVSFGITRLICAFYGTTRLLCRVRVQRGADRREAGRMREGHMDVSGFLIASADVFC